MDVTQTTKKLAVGISMLLAMGSAVADGWDPGTKATNMGSIANTRHNMTMSYNGNHAVMDLARNDYGAICVYCHTPHGGNKAVGAAPLWNRTVNKGSYTIYDKPTTLMRPIGQPGPSSLTCLSCHDGTITIDSVLNMPGAGLNPMDPSKKNSETGNSNIDFLDQWGIAGNPGPPPLGHATLGPELAGLDPTRPGDIDGTCALCHVGDIGVKSYAAFMIGTDLRNDHPVGVQFPDTFTPEADFNEPSVKLPGKMAFFDNNGNLHADPDEVRLYDSGDGYEVECASCHDPHGVPSGGSGTSTIFSPSFLRVNNGDASGGTISNGPSALCLTCHAK